MFSTPFRHLPKLAAILLILTTSLFAQSPSQADIARWESQARHIIIIRDDWGIAHVYGKTDADAVFGSEYAQAEDDFNRIETNYLLSLGRLAEAEGESKIYQDLRQKLFIDPADLKAKYEQSPAWLKKLMDAFADGLNFYLYKHTDVHPRVIQHFEPWMALSFTEGSIGGDIEEIKLSDLGAFYGPQVATATSNLQPASLATTDADEPCGFSRCREDRDAGSNGFAIAPSNTADHHSLLLINPHTSFFFRSELQTVSDEGLNAYGASTWGQFFLYQGFNDRVGWMHTSSNVDDIDEYLETVTKRGDRYSYTYGEEHPAVETSVITVPYKTATGMAEKKFTVYRTTHGPIIRKEGDKWVAVKLMQKPILQLEQSFLRTKARNYEQYWKTMQFYANSSNNTVYADADGNIAYFHGNFIPRRDPQFDYTKPVDGSNPATDWHESLTVAESLHLLNPKSGWLYNSNDAPWNVAGESSPKKQFFPAYTDQGGETARGLHSARVLESKKDFTLDSLISAAYDSYLPWFTNTIPALVRAYDNASASDPLKTKLADQIAALRSWDLRWSADSIPTSLAVFWASDISKRVHAQAAEQKMPDYTYVATKAEPSVLLESLSAASDRLAADFGTWKTKWGDINRFQRVNDDIYSHFDDAQPSIPVPFTWGGWGSIASFAAKPYPNTKKWYGTSGNSFVAVVEFGPRIHARAVTCGGENGRPGAKHFNDEAERYATGNLREVYFYRDQLKGHTERTYHPGE